MEREHIEITCFLGEQDGASERKLKNGLFSIIRSRKDVDRAYLARIQYRSGRPGVALCIAGHSVSEDTIQSIAGVFRSLFRDDCYLDVLLLDPVNEANLTKVCSPFFDAAVPRKPAWWRRGS